MNNISTHKHVSKKVFVTRGIPVFSMFCFAIVVYSVRLFLGTCCRSSTSRECTNIRSAIGLRHIIDVLCYVFAFLWLVRKFPPNYVCCCLTCVCYSHTIMCVWCRVYYIMHVMLSANKVISHGMRLVLYIMFNAMECMSSALFWCVLSWLWCILICHSYQVYSHVSVCNVLCRVCVIFIFMRILARVVKTWVACGRCGVRVCLICLTTMRWIYKKKNTKLYRFK